MPFCDLTKKPRFLFDGGMGTMLQQSGVETGECPELLNLTQPEAIAAIQRQYAQAGAMIVETNT
ncbi:MAG: homocysteine S-methyltransferase family protein, partial [Christensenellaceae bacterium]